MTMQKIAITIDESLLNRIDRLISEKRFPNRSRAIQEAVFEKIERMEAVSLARELSKLDPAFEKKLADDDMGADEWPEY